VTANRQVAARPGEFSTPRGLVIVGSTPARRPALSRVCCAALRLDPVAPVRGSSTGGDAAVVPVVHRPSREPLRPHPLDRRRDGFRGDAVEADREVRTIDAPPPPPWLVARVVSFVQAQVLGSTASRARWHWFLLRPWVCALGPGADGQHTGSVTPVKSGRPATATRWLRHLFPSRPILV